MTEEQFLALFKESQRRLNMYIMSQVTQDEIAQASHHKKALVMNEGFYRSVLVTSNEPYHLCKHCGYIELARYNDEIMARLRKDETCFVCDLWEQRARHYAHIGPCSQAVIVNGAIFGDAGNSPGGMFLGHGGNVFTIKQTLVDGSVKVWQTNNLWHGGTIPQEFRERMADNAEFVR
jgi:hypothetical protein